MLYKTFDRLGKVQKRQTRIYCIISNETSFGFLTSLRIDKVSIVHNKIKVGVKMVVKNLLSGKLFPSNEIRLEYYPLDSPYGSLTH